MRAYSAAERRGPGSLRRFLLDLDAREANAIDGRTLGEVVELYFALDADPRLQGGLAPQTFWQFAGSTSAERQKRTERRSPSGPEADHRNRRSAGDRRFPLGASPALCRAEDLRL
jgi:hypothetical protein